MEAGASEKRARVTAHGYESDPWVRSRITELVAVVADAQGAVIASRTNNTELLKAVSVSKNYVLNILIRNIEEARADKQYATVKSSVELLAKVAGIYIEGIKHTYDFPTDLGQCTEEQLKVLEELLLTLAYGQDEARKRMERKRLEAAAGLVIEATPLVEEPEKKIDPEW